MVSGSHCCDPWTVHLFLRKADGSFSPRREVTVVRLDLTPAERGSRFRGHSRPHLLDWNRDGKTDLVLSDQWCWGAGPLAGKTEVGVKPFPLPKLPDTHPLEVEFTDWDGDGTFDLLMAAQRLKTKVGPWLYDIYWFRNTAARGEPTFEPPVRLLSVPEPWEVNGFAAVNRDRSGRPDLVVGVTKNWQRKPDRRWTVDSQLWRYRRKAEPGAAPDTGRR